MGGRNGHSVICSKASDCTRVSTPTVTVVGNVCGGAADRVIVDGAVI